MPSSIRTMVDEEMQCESLLDCFHGLKDLDRTCFETLVESEEPLTVDEIAARVDRERSTAYRAIQRLLNVGLVAKEQVNRDGGSYYHVYRPIDAEQAADEMERMLDDWYAQMGQLIVEFREKYADESD
jgi:predicted transcriptional regulator